MWRSLSAVSEDELTLAATAQTAADAIIMASTAAEGILNRNRYAAVWLGVVHF